MGIKRQTTNIVWECSKLQSFWENVHIIIKDILGYEIAEENTVSMVVIDTEPRRYLSQAKRQ